MLPRGLEPRTLGLLDLRSDQLSYESLYSMISGSSRRTCVKERPPLPQSMLLFLLCGCLV